MLQNARLLTDERGDHLIVSPTLPAVSGNVSGRRKFASRLTIAEQLLL
jgi:hypothetical protein